MSKPCDGCGKEIIFAKSSSTDKWMPVDDDASEQGNIRIDFTYSPPRAIVLAKERLDDARESGERLHLSHFVTCPKSKSFRK